MVETTPVTTLDIFPTVLDAAGLKTNQGDGIDLGPLLRGEKLAPRDLYWHYPHYQQIPKRVGNLLAYQTKLALPGDLPVPQSVERLP